jgi:hypothetical protein
LCALYCIKGYKMKLTDESTFLELKCECVITVSGNFIVGEKCLKKKCKECMKISTLHPFGENRL